MDLRTRYTALVTLMTQCVKFASETLRRAEDEEVSVVIVIECAGYYYYWYINVAMGSIVQAVVRWLSAWHIHPTEYCIALFYLCL